MEKEFIQPFYRVVISVMQKKCLFMCVVYVYEILLLLGLLFYHEKEISSNKFCGQIFLFFNLQNVKKCYANGIPNQRY